MWGYTLEQIRAATKAQVINAITNKLNGMTKKEIIELVMQVLTVGRNPQVTLRPDGQRASMEQVMENAIGDKVGSTLTEFAYYPTGEIDTITVIERDASDAEVGRRVIKHYLDGTQPTVGE